jgi:hydroxymethylpyrimidine pyrophosphatase-like HAD family hydrolase
MAKIVICDIDGTIADKSHRAGVKKPTLEQVLADEPIQNVLDVVYTLGQWGYSIVFSSSRHADLYDPTYRWLEAQGFNHPVVYLRDAKDKSPDEVIKERNLLRMLTTDVMLVIDDKKSCVDMYLTHGLTVFHCKQPTT